MVIDPVEEDFRPGGTTPATVLLRETRPHSSIRVWHDELQKKSICCIYLKEAGDVFVVCPTQILVERNTVPVFAQTCFANLEKHRNVPDEDQIQASIMFKQFQDGQHQGVKMKSCTLGTCTDIDGTSSKSPNSSSSRSSGTAVTVASLKAPHVSAPPPLCDAAAPSAPGSGNAAQPPSPPACRKELFQSFLFFTCVVSVHRVSRVTCGQTCSKRTEFFFFVVVIVRFLEGREPLLFFFSRICKHSKHFFPVSLTSLLFGCPTIVFSNLGSSFKI